MPLESYITNFRTVSIHSLFEWSKTPAGKLAGWINININSNIINNNSNEICTVFVDVFHVFSNDTIYQLYIYI